VNTDCFEHRDLYLLWGYDATEEYVDKKSVKMIELPHLQTIKHFAVSPVLAVIEAKAIILYVISNYQQPHLSILTIVPSFNHCPSQGLLSFSLYKFTKLAIQNETDLV
jgi:hypothetical protein